MTSNSQQINDQHGPLGDAMPWVARWLAGLAAGSTVLDFACGEGRHAILAASLGHQVLAADRNREAMAALPASIETCCTDLEADPWPFAGRRFDAIVVTNYLFRNRLALLTHLLTSGGRLIYATFGQGNEQFGRPRSPDFLLAPGELLAVAQAAGLTVAGFESGYVESPKPAVVERLCAWRKPVSGGVFALD